MRRTMILAMTVLCAVALTTIVNAEILQPGPDVGKDATVMSDKPTTASGEWVVMYLAAYTKYGTRLRHSFIEFDVSGISTAPGDIASVKLSLLDYYYANLGDYTDDCEIGLYQVTSAWDEDTITYNSQPSFNSPPVATIMMPAQLTEAEADAGGTWHVWDSNGTGNVGFVDLVKGWADESINNYGLMVRLTDPSNTTYEPAHYYRTSNWEVASERPMLEITPVPEPGCVVLLLCGMALLLLIAWRRG